MKKLISRLKSLTKKQKIILGSIIVGVVVLIVGIVVGIILLTGKEDGSTLAPEKKKPDIPAENKEVQIVDVNSKTRPYAVMINNINEARIVQSGLPEAYLVYEIVAEGGITRMLALFKDAQVDKIGSVRSSRDYYIDYALESDAIYIHCGGSPKAYADLNAGIINNIDCMSAPGSVFYRDNPFGIAYEHTLFTDSTRINSAITSYGYKAETNKGLLLKYSADSVNLEKHDGTPATDVSLVYSPAIVVSYKYDESTKTYKRMTNSNEHKDYPTGKQLSVKNIIAYQIASSTIAGDNKGRQELDNLGSGNAYYISEGKVVKIKWAKASREAKTVYTYESGEELVVNDGNTFIQIIPTSGSIKVS